MPTPLATVGGGRQGRRGTARKGIAHRVILSLKRLGAGHSSGWFSSVEPLSLRGWQRASAAPRSGGSGGASWFPAPRQTASGQYLRSGNGAAHQKALSRANGTKFGRPRKVDDPEHIATAKRMKADGHTGKGIAKYLGVSRATLYRYLAHVDVA